MQAILFIDVQNQQNLRKGTPKQAQARTAGPTEQNNDKNPAAAR